MSQKNSDAVPQGFTRMPVGLGFTDTLQPSYRRIEGDSVSFGLVVESQHSNSLGICHGGIVARFNGTFYLPDHDGMWKDGRTGDGVLRDLAI